MFSVAIGCVHQTRDMFLLFHTRYGSILLQLFVKVTNSFAQRAKLFVSVRKAMAELHGSYFMLSLYVVTQESNTRPIRCN